MPQSEALSFAAFQRLLADLLELDVEQIRPEAYFITDLGVDSIRMVEVLLALEEMEIEISPDLAWQIHTVEDAYNYYLQKTSERNP